MITEHPETTTTARAEAVGFIRFHGLTLMSVSHAGKEYVPVRPICELIGIDWKTQKNVLDAPYGRKMYGTCWLISPKINGFSELKLQKNCHIRVNRVEAFLLSPNPKRIEANGNAEAARWLMALHHEWADALHAYETHGIAVKPGRTNKPRELLQWARLRNQLSDLNDRRIVDQIIHDELAALGLPANTLDDAQFPLPLPGNA